MHVNVFVSICENVQYKVYLSTEKEFCSLSHIEMIGPHSFKSYIERVIGKINNLTNRDVGDL